MRSLILICLVLAIAGPAAAPATAADYPPGIMYSTMLNGLNLLSKTGELSLNNIQAVFLPEPTNGGYNPDGGTALWAILSAAGGKELFRYDFYTEKLESPYWLLSSYKVKDLTSGAQQGDTFINLSKPGKYVLDFYLASGKFYSFPFAVSVMQSDDPFAGGDQYVLDGAWENWGYFFYPGADPEQSLLWKIWLRQREFGPEPSFTPLLEIRNSAGKLVCNSREGYTIDFKPEWVRFEFDMVLPKESEAYGQYFKAKDLLGKDGAYTLTFKLDGKLYGTWKFEVRGGKFAYTGRTVRGAGDPLTFIEGGRDAFWYERK